MEDAARFIDAVGFTLLFASTQGIVLPSLFEAIKGRRHVHIDDWDEDADRLWVWKNDLPAERRAYYGKVLGGGKPALVSLQMLPYLHAVSAPEDPEVEYAHGRLSLSAIRIVRALRMAGPMPTMALRASAGLDKSTSSNEFHHALDELQRMLIIAPVGAILEKGAWPSQIYELVDRWFPRQVARARRIDEGSARRALLDRYIRTAVAVQPQMVAQAFGWSRPTVQALIEAGVARKRLMKKDDWVMFNARQ